jgi:GxxExxY protein
MSVGSFVSGQVVERAFQYRTNVLCTMTSLNSTILTRLPLLPVSAETAETAEIVEGPQRFSFIPGARGYRAAPGNRLSSPCFHGDGEGETMSDVSVVSGQVVDAAFHIHYQLGPGLFESVYEHLLERSLLKRGLAVERQSRVGFDFNGERFDNAFRADLLVEQCVLVEVKSVVELTPVHFMQVRTYLRLLDYPVGLLINFNVDLIKHGIKRLLNNRSAYGRTIRLPLHEGGDPVQK